MLGTIPLQRNFMASMPSQLVAITPKDDPMQMDKLKHDLRYF